MPIYEYQCAECGHELEALQRISEPLLTDCPECGEPALRKLVSAPSFRLKGGGWYETDFKTGDKKKNLAGEKEAGGTVNKGDKAAEKSDAAADSRGNKKKTDSGSASSGKSD